MLMSMLPEQKDHVRGVLEFLKEFLFQWQDIQIPTNDVRKQPTWIKAKPHVASYKCMECCSIRLEQNTHLDNTTPDNIKQTNSWFK